MLGRDESDPLFLQFKEAQSSVLEEFCGRSEYRNHAHRVVAGQRLMQAAGDIFLGWLHVTGLDAIERDYYVRQLRDWKGSAEDRADGPAGDGDLRPSCAGGRSPVPTRIRETASRSRPTSAKATRLTARLRRLRLCMRTRTNAITRRSRRPLPQGAWRQRRVSRTAAGAGNVRGAVGASSTPTFGATFRREQLGGSR